MYYMQLCGCETSRESTFRDKHFLVQVVMGAEHTKISFTLFSISHLKTKTKLTVHGLIDQIREFKTEFSSGTETGNPST